MDDVAADARVQVLHGMQRKRGTDSMVGRSQDFPRLEYRATRLDLFTYLSRYRAKGAKTLAINQVNVSIHWIQLDVR